MHCENIDCILFFYTVSGWPELGLPLPSLPKYWKVYISHLNSLTGFADYSHCQTALAALVQLWPVKYFPLFHNTCLTDYYFAHVVVSMLGHHLSQGHTCLCTCSCCTGVQGELGDRWWQWNAYGLVWPNSIDSVCKYMVRREIYVLVSTGATLYNTVYVCLCIKMGLLYYDTMGNLTWAGKAKYVIIVLHKVMGMLWGAI